VKEDARLKRNIQRQVELYPTFAARVVRIIATLEAAGFRPRIQDAWRSAAAQAELFAKGTTKVKFGFHNVTGTGGRPESLAVDLLDLDVAFIVVLLRCAAKICRIIDSAVAIVIYSILALSFWICLVVILIR